MGRFQVVSGALAIAGDRLVAIVNVERAGSVQFVILPMETFMK